MVLMMNDDGGIDGSLGIVDLLDNYVEMPGDHLVIFFHGTDWNTAVDMFMLAKHKYLLELVKYRCWFIGSRQKKESAGDPCNVEGNQDGV